MNKDNAFNDQVGLIEQSWTYSRLTAEEKERCIEALRYTHLSGTYQKRCEALHDVYHAFLLGLGYKPTGWREEPNTPFN